MKKIFKSVLTLGLVAGLGFAANAQKTATAPSSATILANLTITLDGTQDEIAFGNLSSSTIGPVVLDANGTGILVNNGGTGDILSSTSNTGSNTNVARFDIAGSNDAVTVSYDATVTLTSGLNTMTMTPEVVGSALSTNQATATAVSSGSQITPAGSPIPVYFLWVGGSIPALVGQATGTYTGTFNIDVEYN